MSQIENGPIPEGWRYVGVKVLEDIGGCLGFGWMAGWWVWAGRSPAGSMAVVVVGLQVAHGAGEERSPGPHKGGPHRATPDLSGRTTRPRPEPRSPEQQSHGANRTCLQQPLTIQPNPKKA